MDMIEEDRSLEAVSDEPSADQEKGKQGNKFVQGLKAMNSKNYDDQKDVINENRGTGQELKPMSNMRTKRPAPLEILNRVTINNTLETPRSSIRGILNVPNQTELKFSKENLSKVEDQLKSAFVEFDHKLRLLKSYRYISELSVLLLSVHSSINVVLVSSVIL